MLCSDLHSRVQPTAAVLEQAPELEGVVQVEVCRVACRAVLEKPGMALTAAVTCKHEVGFSQACPGSQHSQLSPHSTLMD